MTTTNRSDHNHRLIDLRYRQRRCILRAPADGEKTQPRSPGLRLGQSGDGGTGESSGDASTWNIGGHEMSEEYKTTWAEDEDVEWAVLQQLLDLHPTRLTLEELAREFGARHSDFAANDAVERAVRDLAAAGLLHRGAEFVAPTRAALRFNELLDR
jgi:hypothetical protein